MRQADKWELGNLKNAFLVMWNLVRGKLYDDEPCNVIAWPMLGWLDDLGLQFVTHFCGCPLNTCLVIQYLSWPLKFKQLRMIFYANECAKYIEGQIHDHRREISFKKITGLFVNLKML